MKDQERRPEGVNESQIHFSSDFGLCPRFNPESLETAQKAHTSQLVTGRIKSSNKNTPEKVRKTQFHSSNHTGRMCISDLSGMNMTTHITSGEKVKTLPNDVQKL